MFFESLIHSPVEISQMGKARKILAPDGPFSDNDTFQYALIQGLEACFLHKKIDSTLEKYILAVPISEVLTTTLKETTEVQGKFNPNEPKPLLEVVRRAPQLTLTLRIEMKNADRLHHQELKRLESWGIALEEKTDAHTIIRLDGRGDLDEHETFDAFSRLVDALKKIQRTNDTGQYLREILITVTQVFTQIEDSSVKLLVDYLLTAA